MDQSSRAVWRRAIKSSGATNRCRVVFSAIAVALIALASCKSPATEDATAGRSSKGLPRTADSRDAGDAAAASKARRIVSLSVGTDEILCALVGEDGLDRVTALSTYSVEPELSNVADIAGRVGTLVERTAEHIVSLRPDLVLAARYTRAELRKIIAQTGVPMVVVSDFRTISDIEANIRLIAQAIGEEARGTEIIEAMHFKLADAGVRLKPENRSLRVLYLSPGNWTAGMNTNVHEIITAAGLVNAAAEAGVNGHTKISAEKILEIAPDLLLVSTGHERDRDFDKQIMADAQLAALGAVKNRRIILLPSRYLRTVSHYLADGVRALVDAVNSSP